MIRSVALELALPGSSVYNLKVRRVQRHENGRPEGKMHKSVTHVNSTSSRAGAELQTFFSNRQKRACSFYRKMNGKLGLFSTFTHIFMQSKVLKLKLSRSFIEIIHTLVCWTPCRDKDSKRSLEKVMIRTISKSVSARPLNLYTLLRAH